ncbi:MAG: hypothetical protein IT363_13415 [Methanoregulaceae archaeon]|nr:hypothetical protein [Methanoregulaceae archaeon]
MRVLVVMLLVCLGFVAPAQARRSQSYAPVPSEVRSTAKSLAKAWITTASPDTLDQLAYRSIAFAGMVPGIEVVLDGRRMSATTALKDSALTIIGQHDQQRDAEAIRNIVYALHEIGAGRTFRTIPKR